MKEGIRIGTWNVRSMYTGKIEVIQREMERIGIAVLGISEMRWKGKGHIQAGQNRVMFSGNDNDRRNGVAFICTKETTKSILGYNPVNDRIITIRLAGKNVNKTIIQVYAPTTAAKEEEIEEFYITLQEVFDKVPKNDIIIVMGDFNAKVGRGAMIRTVGAFGLGERNEAGDKLVDFASSNGLRITNTFFKQHNRRLYTWISPDGLHRNQIDYILVNNRWASTIQSAHTLPGADCGSDHQLLVAKIRVKLKKQKRHERAKCYDFEKIPTKYSISVQNRFQLLQWGDKEPEDEWEEIKSIIKQEAEKNVPIKRKGTKSPWLSQATLEIATKRRNLKKKGGCKADIQKLNRNFQTSARKDKEVFYESKCAELEAENKKGHTRDLFRKVKQITGKVTPKINGIKNRDGELVMEEEQVKSRWKEYTEELYKKDVRINEPFSKAEYIRETEIRESEVRRALEQINNNKAPGYDGIPIELIKAAGDESIRVMTRLCQHIWETEQWPKDWKRSIFIPIPKKGDTRECGNNRTIALISHTSKILLKIIQNRMESYVERELPEEQAGFRKKRGTRDHIANLRWILEKANEFKQDVYICFIDYSKAFDCVDHEIMWKTLRKMGIPEHLIELVHKLYDKQEATVRTEYGDTEFFSIGKGVRQGCILSPSLFNLYAEEIMRRAEIDRGEEGIKIDDRRINNLRYADDTTLIERTEKGLRNIIERVKLEGEKMGLYLNLAKTKVLTNTGMSTFEIGNNSIEVVQSIIFLGSTITNKGECIEEVKRRLVLGRVAMGGMERIWKGKDISIKIKKRLIQALIHPVAMYGCETWTLKSEEKRRIQAFENWCWRRMLRISWKEKKTNESIQKRLEITTFLLDKMAKQKLTYFGHVMRAMGMEKIVMLGVMEGKRGKGRPKKRWLDDIKEWTDMEMDQLRYAVRDRGRWRNVVAVSMSRSRLGATR